MRGSIPEQGHIAYAELSHCMRNDKQASLGPRWDRQVDMILNMCRCSASTCGWAVCEGICAR